MIFFLGQILLNVSFYLTFLKHNHVEGKLYRKLNVELYIVFPYVCFLFSLLFLVGTDLSKNEAID